MSQKRLFLTAVLGADGAHALLKAAERVEEIGTALVPRTILAWIDLATRYQYEGELPGVSGSHVSFAKSEEGFSGSVSVGDSVYVFEDTDVYHLAAAVGLSLGVTDEPVSKSISDRDLSKLGKSVDLLVKARVVADALEKKDLPGMTALPTEAAAPLAPTPPSRQINQPPAPKQKPKLPKVKKPTLKIPSLPSLKLSERDLSKACPACGGSQFRQGKFKGCLCFSAMADAVTMTKSETGYKLDFKAPWDADAIQTLIETLRVR